MMNVTVSHKQWTTMLSPFTVPLTTSVNPK